MNNTANSSPRENFIAGLVGAFLFSLAGGIAWFVFSLIGFTSALSGLIGVICAIKGYEIFAKKLSVKGVICSAIIALLVLVLAWYLCFSLDLMNAYKEWFANGEVDFVPTFGQCVQIGPAFLAEPDIAGPYFLNLGLGLLLAFVGAIGSIINTVKAVKAANAAPAIDPAVQNTFDYSPVSETPAPEAAETPAPEAAEAPVDEETDTSEENDPFEGIRG